MIRTANYKYVFAPKPRMIALYDLGADPEENVNLAAAPQHADLVRQMHRRLLEVMRADGDPLREAFPEGPLDRE
jgi:arylsulfatase A-like enzyme